MIRRPPRSTPLSLHDALPISLRRTAAAPLHRPRARHRAPRAAAGRAHGVTRPAEHAARRGVGVDRKSTRLNSSHANISYAVFCLKKNKDDFEFAMDHATIDNN